ncbi:MAG TPA: transglutaminase-like domain-containing protein [Ktedonobacterales bacterium]
MADSRLGKMRMTRSRRRMLAGIRERDPEPLTRPRPLERRWLGNCRDFAVLLCALLRAHRRPARVRYGFATYFAPGVNTDHVVCEVWNAEDDRWRLVDPMIDDFPRAAYAIHVDTHDPPEAAFVPAGRGWQWCREGRARPGQFGIGRRAPRGI